MAMKKTILLFALMLGILSSGFPQRIINEQIEVNGKETSMKFKFADDIVLEAWDKDYIELKVEVDIDDNKYNDFYALEIDKSAKIIELVEKVDFEGIKKEVGSKKYHNFNTELHYALKVPKNLKVELETISGEVELIGCRGKMEINSISGFIDYSIPQNHKANIDLSTVTGDVYSNVKFDDNEAKAISWVGTKEQLSLNGGDVPVNLKTVSGDIFLRKK